ncbi:ABC-type transport system, ATPase component [Bacillus methanolicus PB1]|uniref:ABC-type transport system, ATPase component n=1 Tax=Bacillus methanolicus PB1 TaxID=997296 RepID=I3E156_BACMT|nr:ABC transporter ATP-binding protein [Bacillus methanolicus]EIJ80227.1 ABC-type transport system, ATPase component [Bacillus methanolicus PB1]
MIDVKNLTYAYPGKKSPSVKEIQMSIQKGEIFGLLGPSGAGKSTTQKILIGLLKGYSGSVRVFGKEVRDLQSDYYEKIGVAFEFPNFYSKFSAIENLRHFSRLYSVETTDPDELLSMVGLWKDRDTKVSAFSKGMKMRLNFCRALLNNPEIIFLDEPTSGLDPVNGKMMRSKILELKAAGKTIVITTHNMTLAEELCDRVAFIVDGQIHLIDSPKSLKLQKGKKTVRIEYMEGNETKEKDFPLSTLKDNSEFQTLIQSGQILTIHTQEASLEEIFIEVTGRSLL